MSSSLPRHPSVAPHHSPHARPGRWRLPLSFALAAAVAVSAAVTLPAARAALSAEARGPALLLLEQLAASEEGQPHVVVLNGQRLLVRSKTTDSPVSAVLDAFELECDGLVSEASRGAAAAPREVSGLATPSAAAFRPERWLAARHADPAGDVGQSACFAPSDARGLSERLWDFVRDGDLSSLGQARYLLARRAPAAAGTHVLEIAAPGPFSLRALLGGPEAQPAAAEPVPAPAGAELLLESRVEGQPHAVRLYTSPEQPRVLLDRYTRQLVDSGFERVPSPPDDGGAPDGAAQSRALLGAELATLLSASRVGGQTLLSRVELARPRRVSSAPGAR
jgi:hypothetical protein